MHNFRSRSLLVAASAMAICLPAAAVAQTRSFDISAQPASTGVREFARQAGVQITLAGRDGDGRKTSAVKGTLEIRQALDRLLAGTGLVVRSFDGRLAILGSGERAEADTVETIVVTGTRIARPDLESPMPVSVVRPDEAKVYGRNTIYDALTLNPAIGAGVGEMNSGGQEFDQGVANINLRNLGANRSLVLVDGRRWVSSGARTSAVDLNTIPAALIDRMEIVTGGAAAIYGADAVSGAVNIIMKKKVSGVQLSATTGVSGEGDARQTNLSLATGLRFQEGRGHVVIGGDYTDTAAIENLARYPKHATYAPNPLNTGPRDGIPDNVLIRDTRQLHRSSVPTFCLPAGAACQQWYQLINGVVTAVPQNSYQVILTGPTGTQQGGPANSSTSFENVLLRPKTRRASVYSNVSYALTPTLTGNGTFSYAHSYTKATPNWPAIRSDSRATNWWGGTTGEIATLSNPFLPDSMRQFMVANNLTAVPLGRTYLNLPRAFEIQKRDSFTVGADLTGRVTDRLKWQGFVRYGQVINNITTTNMVGKNDWLAGRNAIRDASGQIVCADPAARAAGCVPINIFTTEPFSQEVLNYIEHERYERSENALLNAGVNVSGPVFSLPAGDVAIAVGAEWRRETLKTRDDPDTAKLANIVYAGGLDYKLHPALNADRDTAELYGEVLVPLLADLPFVKRLEIEGAYRYSDYSDNPSTRTWKTGATWQLVDGVTFRGVFSRSVRVPNFGELFSPVTQATFGNIEDPCQAGFITQNPNRAANCAALIKGVQLPLPRPNNNSPRVFGGGNPNLSPERSKSFTVGAVLQPRFAPGLDLTLDYWNIDLRDAITALPYTTILNNCVDSAGGLNQAYCQFITRNAQGEVASVEAQFANLSARSSRGVDLGVNYRKPIGGGQFRASFAGSYLFEQTIVAAAGKPGIDYAGEWDFPRLKATLVTDYAIGKFAIGLNTRFISRSEYDITAPSDETFEVSHIPAHIYNDVTLTYRPTDKSMISVGVKNLSDIRVPVVLRNNYISPSAPSFRQDGAANYDAIGRYFFVRFGADF